MGRKALPPVEGLPIEEVDWTQSSESNDYTFVTHDGKWVKRYYAIVQRDGRKAWFAIVLDPSETKGRSLRTYVSDLYYKGLSDASVDLYFGTIHWLPTDLWEPNFAAAEVDAFNLAFERIKVIDDVACGLYNPNPELNLNSSLMEEIEDPETLEGLRQRQKYRRTFENAEKKRALDAQRHAAGKPALNKEAVSSYSLFDDIA